MAAVLGSEDTWGGDLDPAPRGGRRFGPPQPPLTAPNGPQTVCNRRTPTPNRFPNRHQGPGLQASLTLKWTLEVPKHKSCTLSPSARPLPPHETRAVLKNCHFFFVKDSPQRPATANHQLPTANRQPPTASHGSILLLWLCVLPMS